MQISHFLASLSSVYMCDIVLLSNVIFTAKEKPDFLLCFLIANTKYQAPFKSNDSLTRSACIFL